MCFDSISTKDNLVEKSGAVRQAFSVRASGVRAQKKNARQTSARMKSLTGKALKHAQIMYFCDSE